MCETNFDVVSTIKGISPKKVNTKRYINYRNLFAWRLLRFQLQIINQLAYLILFIYIIYTILTVYNQNKD